MDGCEADSGEKGVQTQDCRKGEEAGHERREEIFHTDDEENRALCVAERNHHGMMLYKKERFVLLSVLFDKF